MEFYAEFDKSTGHIAFIEGYEYFVVKGDGMYRACVNTTYIMPSSGYRSGGRWQCPESMAGAMLSDIRQVAGS